MFCRYCGAWLSDDATKCTKCDGLTELGEEQAVRGESGVGGNANPENSGNPVNNETPVNPDGSLNMEAYRAANRAGNVDGRGNGGGYYYAPQNAEPARETEKQSNNMALAGFICAFLFSFVGLILSIIGLNKSKELGGEGRGLAIAGIIISLLSVVGSVLLIGGYITFLSTILEGFVG